jgi:RimJ/RimL family protein N-acetyltransferase
VNMFLTIDDDEEDGETRVIGELELMIATKAHQNQGRGRCALLAFLRYIAEHEYSIVDEVLSTASHTCKARRLSYVCAKIGEQNHRSIGLFESLGFVKTSTESSYFGEFELRRKSLSLEAVESLFEEYKIGNYSEMVYEDCHGTYFEHESVLS